MNDRHLEYFADLMHHQYGMYTWTIPNLFYVLSLTTSEAGRKKIIESDRLRRTLSILIDRINDDELLLANIEDEEIETMILNMYTFWQSLDDIGGSNIIIGANDLY